MVVRHRKKSRHLRGTKMHGIRTKRKAGQRGGRGRAGIGKRAGHKKEHYRHSEKFLGPVGFVSVYQKKGLHPKAINVRDIDKNLEALQKKNLIEKTKEGYKVDLSKLGFDKLIGSGRVSNKLLITTKLASPKAIQKVEEAGGKVEVLQKEELLEENSSSEEN